MDFYDYCDWVGWGESDVREYASEIAVQNSLTIEKTSYLSVRMLEQAGHWPDTFKKRAFDFPRKMDAELEDLTRRYAFEINDAGDTDDQIFEENARLNRPWRDQSFKGNDVRWETIGSGLTRRFQLKYQREPPILKKQRQRSQRQSAVHPFSSMNMRMRRLSDAAMWAANCYPIDSRNWLIPSGIDAPYKGALWYSREMMQSYYNARGQAELGNVEGAMWHAFRAGELSAELNLIIAHGQTFEKYEAVQVAQQDAARSRKVVSDEVRREAYQRYRDQGNKRVEAGRLAASDLGLSEPSIRNAFPNGRYPPG